MQLPGTLPPATPEEAPLGVPPSVAGERAGGLDAVISSRRPRAGVRYHPAHQTTRGYLTHRCCYSFRPSDTKDPIADRQTVRRTRREPPAKGHEDQQTARRVTRMMPPKRFDGRAARAAFVDGNCSTRFGLIECRKQASTRASDGRPAIIRRNLSTDGQAYRRVAVREPAQLPQSMKRPSPPWSRGASTWSHGSAGSSTPRMDYPILYFSTGTCRPGAGRSHVGARAFPSRRPTPLRSDIPR